MDTYTVFCTDANRDEYPAIWIQAVQATSKKEAMQCGIELCAADWDCSEADVVAIGVAEGDVNILAWMDEGYTYGELTTAGFEV